jgi:hypothetical protein
MRLIRDKASGEMQCVASIDGYDMDLFDDLGEVPEGVDPMLARVDDVGAIVEDLAPLWAALRARRDALLYVTDGTQATDRPDEYRAAWAAYRAALRDLPDVAGDPREAVWPTPPDVDELARMQAAFARAAGPA